METGSHRAQNGFYIANGWWPDSPAFTSQMLRLQESVLYFKGRGEKYSNAEENLWRVEGGEPGVTTLAVKLMLFVVLQKYQTLNFFWSQHFPPKAHICICLKFLIYYLSKKFVGPLSKHKNRHQLITWK